MSQQARNNPDLPPMHSVFPDRPRKYATDPQNKPGMSPANEAQGHSPLPWREHDMESDAIVGADRKAIALVMGRNRTPEEDAANLALIVQAVNSHADLLAETARLRASNEALSYAMELIYVHSCEDHIINRARAALAQANGGSK